MKTGRSSSNATLLDKKRSRIRQQLHRGMNDRAFRQRVASHVRAIRYMRLRNSELAMMNCLVRLQRLLGSELALKVGVQLSFESRHSLRPSKD